MKLRGLPADYEAAWRSLEKEKGTKFKRKQAKELLTLKRKQAEQAAAALEAAEKSAKPKKQKIKKLKLLVKKAQNEFEAAEKACSRVKKAKATVHRHNPPGSLLSKFEVQEMEKLGLVTLQYDKRSFERLGIQIPAVRFQGTLDFYEAEAIEDRLRVLHDRHFLLVCEKR